MNTSSSFFELFCIVMLMAAFPVSNGTQAIASNSAKPHRHPSRPLMRSEESATMDTNLCHLLRMRNPLDNKSQEIRFRRRDSPVRIVDFFHFAFEHELPILRLRLAQMAPYVDEIHIAEGDRDFLGFTKSFVFQKLLASDPELAQWREKIVYHPVHVNNSLETGRDVYKIQWAINKAKYNISGAGVLIDGDLDEIVSRTVLQSIRSCEPVQRRKDWKGGIQMYSYMYNMGWRYKDYWPKPCFFRDIERLAADTDKMSLLEKPSSLLEKHAKYIWQISDTIALTNGKPAGWHVAWALDGPEGIANKILHGHVEGIPSFFKDHAASEEDLAAFIRTDFLPNPSVYDTNLTASMLQVTDLPEAMVEDPYKYKSLLGDAFPVAFRAHSLAGKRPLLQLREE